jgi:hypothetical protein
MHISMLQFVGKGESIPTEWRMSAGNARLRQFACIQAASQNLEQFESAMLFALSGKNRGDIQRATIEVVDNDGDVWRIVRDASGESQVMKNQQALRSDLEGTALNALLDIGTSDDPEKANILGLIARHFEIQVEQNKLTVQPNEDRQFSTGRLADFSRRKQQEITVECAGMFQMRQLENPRLLTKLVTKIEPFYFQITELIRQKRGLKEVNQHIEELASESLPVIEAQIGLLSEIESVAIPLTDPAQNPSLIQDKLNQVNQRIAEQNQQCGISDLPSFAGDIPWETMLSARARLEAFDRLIQAGEEMRTANEDGLRPAFDDALATVRTVLAQSNQLTGELERCLENVSQHANRIVEYSNAIKSGGIKGKIANFVKPKSAVILDENQTDPAQGLTTIRTSIDFGLTKLGELLATVSSAETNHKKTQEGLHSQLEKLFADFSKMRTTWQRLIQPFGIPEQIRFSELVQLACRHSDLLRLKDERQRLMAILQQRNHILARLEKLIVSYRQKIGSQKDLPLTTAEIIISESQNLVRYKQRKIEHLQKLREAEREIELFNRQKDAINSRLRGLLKSWSEAFEQLNIPTIQVNNQSLLTLFQRTKTIQAFEQIIAETSSALPLPHIFSEKHCDAPIVFVWWRPTQDQTKHAIEIIKEIENSTANAQYIICTTDDVFAQYLHKSGATRGQIQTQKSSASVVPTKNSTEVVANDPNQVRVERAKRMMSVFDNARLKQLGRNE